MRVGGGGEGEGDEWIVVAANVKACPADGRGGK